MKKNLLVGMLVAALIFGMTVVGCDDDSSGGGGGGGGGGPGGGGGGSTGVGIQMVSIPAGTFMMGSLSSEPAHQGDETQHSVTLTKSFKMSKYEVTQKQYTAVMGDNENRVSSYTGDKGDNFPIYLVNWYDAIVFCNKLSIKEGLPPVYSIGGKTNPADWGAIPTEKSTTWDAVVMDKSKNGYRLPTEAEWEYACRGSYANKATETNTLPFGIGTGRKMVSGMANFFVSKPYDLDKQPSPGGEYDDNNPTQKQLYKTAVVGSYTANNYGLFDMHGNSAEWCWDWYDSTYYSSSPANDPTGSDTNLQRVFRDGGYTANGKDVRSAHRGGSAPSFRTGNIGIRLVRTE